MLKHFQIFDKIFPGYLTPVPPLHMLIWWVVMQVHGHSSGESRSCVANVVNRFIAKLAVFVRAYPAVDYVGFLDHIFFMCVISHDHVGCSSAAVVYPEFYFRICFRDNVSFDDVL